MYGVHKSKLNIVYYDNKNNHAEKRDAIARQQQQIKANETKE